MGTRKSPHAIAVRQPPAVGVLTPRQVANQTDAQQAVGAPAQRGLSPSTIAHVQRTAGNQAALRLLGQAPLPVAQRSGAVTVIQREYTLSNRQKNDLKKALAKWEKAYKAEGGEDLGALADDLAAYCDSQRQALTIIEKATYKQWDTANLKGIKAEAFENQLLGIGEDLPKVVVKATKDPLDAVRDKIRGKGWDLTLFSQDDLQRILLNKEDGGWEVALGDTYQRVLKAKQDADAKAKLLLEYAPTKAAGDLVFTNGILAAVWNLGHLIATSPNANINTTIGGEYPDATILAAANAWHGHADIGLVTNIHVPGSGNGRIQDKSTRPVNPDKTRGRQCDFISYWKGNKVNVHVNSDVHHE